MACTHGLEAVPVAQAQALLVDELATRWQAVAAEQLPCRCYRSARWRRRYSRAYVVQGNILPHVGGSVLGEGVRFRRVNAVQEVDERAAFRFEPDSQPSVRALVESDH